MADEVIKRLLVEIDGNVEKLRRELRKGETEVKAFAVGAEKAGKTAGASADVVANKQANAARAIASATETIFRQGKVSAEAAKQIISQGSNAAMFWGPAGAVVGAVGIGTLAIVGMFSRVKREAEEAAKVTRDEFAKMSTLDMMGAARRLAELNAGDTMLREDLGSGDAATRAEALLRFKDDRSRAGVQGLQEESARLRRQFNEISRGPQAGTSDARRAKSALQQQLTEEIAELDRLLPEMEQRAAAADRVFRRRAAEESQRSQDAFAIDRAADAAKAGAKSGEEALREHKQQLAELDRDAGAFADKFSSFVLKTIGSSVDQVAAAFDELIMAATELEGRGDFKTDYQAQIGQLVTLREEAVALARTLGDTEALLTRISFDEARGIEPTVDVFVDLADAAAMLFSQLLKLNPESEQYKKTQAELLKVEERRAALGKGVADANGGPGVSPPDVKDAADYAQQLQQAADGALQLAQNLGGADAAAIGLLRSMGQIAGSLPALDKAMKAGDGMGVIGASLAIVGALSSMFADSPQEKQQRDELKRNTDALAALTKVAGQLGLGVSGSDASAASSDLQRFMKSGKWDEAVKYSSGIPGLPAREAAKKFGLDLAELDKIAKAHGITLNDTTLSWIQLQEALANTITKLGEFDTSLDSQKAQAEAEIEIFGVTDPAEQLRIRQRATAGRSGALDSVTAGLDLSTSDGREQARKNAQAFFEIMKAGGGTLDPSQLGNLTGDEFLQALLDLIKGLDAIGGAPGDESVVGSSSGTVVGLRGLTEATGSRLEDRFRSLDLKASEAQRTRLDMLATLQSIARTPLPVPSLPDGYGGPRGTGTSGGGGITLVIESIVVNVPVTVGGGDPAAVPASVISGLEASMDEALYRSIYRAQVARGDLRAPR